MTQTKAVSHTLADLPEFPGYAVDREGRVWSFISWRGQFRRELMRVANADGYPKVRLVVNGRRVNMAVHRLVASVFLPARPPGYEIRHLNGNKNDNRPENLAWGTQLDNATDREAHGRTSRGERHSVAIKAGLARAVEREVGR